MKNKINLKLKGQIKHQNKHIYRENGEPKDKSEEITWNLAQRGKTL